MEAFTLDTTGSVRLPRSPRSVIRNHLWTDLSPFDQGYIEAAFASILRRERGDANEGHVEKPMAAVGRSYRAFGRFGDVAIGAQSREEALSEALRSRRGVTLADIDAWDGEQYVPVVSFSDLAPSTLEGMLRDCAALRKLNPESAGDLVWACRQAGAWADFPPIRLSLNDEGKIVSEEASVTTEQSVPVREGK